jgi:hypothetical protein
VPFTRPSIFLPQSIYFDRTRQLAVATDGIQLYADKQALGGLFTLQLTAGALEEDELDDAVFGFDPPGEFSSDTAAGARLLYDNQQGMVLALTYAYSKLDYVPGSGGDLFQAGTLTFRPLILSFQYDLGKWEFTSEIASRATKLRDFGPYIPDSHTTGQSGYIQTAYRLDNQWQVLLRYDVLYTDRDDRDGTDYAAATGLPAHSRFAKDWTVGLRWKPSADWMISAEFHHVDGTAWLAAQDNPQPTQRRWNLFATQVSFRF